MKNTRLGKMPVIFSSLLVFALHLLFSFATPADRKPMAKKVVTASAAPELSAGMSALRAERLFMYESLQLDVLGLSHKAYDLAILGLEKLKAAGKITNDGIISIVDFTKSSAEKRLYVIDLVNHKLLFNTYVAHGQNSGKEFANRFSNSPESFQSSLGFYETSGTYNGKNGYSMHLNGLEKGINNNADERAIVMHGAPYVSENFIRSQGFLGRSWGCPAVPEHLNKPIVDKIKNGTCLFIYSENKRYMKQSRILNS